MTQPLRIFYRFKHTAKCFTGNLFHHTKCGMIGHHFIDEHYCRFSSVNEAHRVAEKYNNRTCVCRVEVIEVLER